MDINNKKIGKQFIVKDDQSTVMFPVSQYGALHHQEGKLFAIFLKNDEKPIFQLTAYDPESRQKLRKCVEDFINQLEYYGGSIS